MKKLALVICCISLAACGGDSPEADEEASTMAQAPDLIANNAFYYYNDVDTAWEFYRDVLGFETVVDYGFAKIMRVAQTSYLTLVQAESGMHTAEEPKTVVLRLIIDDLSTTQVVPAEHIERVAIMKDGADGKAAIVLRDPGGYLLTLEEFGSDPGSNPYAAEIGESHSMSVASGNYTVRAAIYSAYMHDLAATQPFYEEMFGAQAKDWLDRGALIHIAGSGYLNLIDGSDSLLEATEKSGVTFSFFTSDVDAWFERASNTPGFELRTPEVFDESGMVRVFVGYDPEGNFLEWDTFLDLQENADLMKYLK